mmetsp:Transcript_19525/g.19192  ORF Transcript_19525/g.19192 Transcript_19525/m.19192 type:complete len:287 (-) Transcript_19525:33-893(-)|eukprot:CAMPEP_0197005954 /NCGR_PEP_ID=MMETSP1380-20130617/32304_1 /TAXON_ID=5936 /ORGANISM="Euplotes crassus, Strain CT5" /LENGTH=286 /DNA_ID=CAMNT_0042425331 /DNA_START=472 /DNA_END=1332 /DNA_ORIENTATION=+
MVRLIELYRLNDKMLQKSEEKLNSFKNKSGKELLEEIANSPKLSKSPKRRSKRGGIRRIGNKMHSKSFLSPSKILKKVRELDEEDEEQPNGKAIHHSNIYSKQEMMKLTKDNLKKFEKKKTSKLDKSGYKIDPCQIEIEAFIQNTPKLSEIPGMSAGKMFKLTEVFSKCMGNSIAATGNSPMLYNDMFYSLCQSSIGGSSCYGFSTARTSHNLPQNVGMMPHGNHLRWQNSKDTISELHKALSFSQLSNAGSDDYKKDIINNKDYLKDFQCAEKERELELSDYADF